MVSLELYGESNGTNKFLVVSPWRDLVGQKVLGQQKGTARTPIVTRVMFGGGFPSIFLWFLSRGPPVSQKTV